MRTRLPALLACAAAGALAGCGGEKPQVDESQIRSVVTQFAESRDAHACDLLSPDRLVALYGDFHKPVEVAKAACVRRSKKFEGQPVRITHLAVLDSSSATVTALDPSGAVTYTIGLRRYGPAWRIDDISQAKTAR
jgi:hypothetical protein